MGWIKAGSIEIFSFADTISSVNNALFKVMQVLFTPFIAFALGIFFIGFLIVIFSIINNKIKSSGVVDGR